MSGTSVRCCILTICVTLLTGGCFAVRPSSGGGQTSAPTARRAAAPPAVVLPPGYRIERVSDELTFPSGVAFDERGVPYVIEAGYSYGERWTTPRLLRIESNGSTTEVARGDHAPWTGVAFHDGAFYVAQGGAEGGGRIVRIEKGGKINPLIENLPSVGDHHTNGPVIGSDGMIYFAVGTATNSGVVGEENAKFGWLKRHPQFCDIPAKDIKLAGQNFTTRNVLSERNSDQSVSTGAFVPFATPTRAGQVIKGKLPATGAIMKIPLGGGTVQLVAWGLRNPFGLAFAPDSSLYATDNSYDMRGSRPVYGTGDLLWRIEPGTWYGWPDFHGDLPLTWSDHFKPPGKPELTFLLAEHPNTPPKPVAKLGVHSSSNGLDFAPGPFGYAGEAFVAQFGDMAPDVGKVIAPVGFKVVRIDTKTGVVHDFAANRGRTTGPASLLKINGLERPTALKFSPDGRSLYVVDFGVMTMSKRGPQPRERTGSLWRITRTGGGSNEEGSR